MGLNPLAIFMDWDTYFLGILNGVPAKSPDEQTKVGALLVDYENHIIGTGYNGFPSGTDDANLPRVRPHKHPYMVHAEVNVVAHLIVKPQKARLYCTHMPCSSCAKLLWQCKVREWNIQKSTMSKINMAHDKEDAEKLYEFLYANGLKVRFI